MDHVYLPPTIVLLGRVGDITKGIGTAPGETTALSGT